MLPLPKRTCDNCKFIEYQQDMRERAGGEWFCDECVPRVKEASTEFIKQLQLQNQNQPFRRTTTDFSSSDDSSQQSQIIRLIGENQELKGDILRLERKIDQLQQQINQIIEQQRVSQN